MPRPLRAVFALVLGCMVLWAASCGGGSTASTDPPPGPPPAPTIVVTTLEDMATPPAGTMTLRRAIEVAAPGERITFAAALNGGTVRLSIVGESHTVLKGEVYSGGPPTFQGYFDRDYGKSALYARKNLHIDASSLPDGITVQWTGGEDDPARVLAVYGDLTLTRVAISGGHSKAEAIADTAQPYTLARGGGLAVWGMARLTDCTISGNKVTGDDTASRDRGAYGGGVYANALTITRCVVSGNKATGYGAAGGGIYSVGGADETDGSGFDAVLSQCTISGNRVTAQHAYGGGIFTLAGGPNNRAWLRMTNCTVARNLVEDNPGLPEAGQFYYRAGGIYMGGGSMELASSTVAENEVTGHAAVFSGKPNMGGGGIAATIGNAHVVEYADVRHCIVAGNKLNGLAEDWFAGSLLHFTSEGYNLFGVLDFSQILVPVPDWMHLSRKHYPKVGDHDGVLIADVLDLAAVQYHPTVLSAGTDAGQPAVLWYPPAGGAVDQVPTGDYVVPSVSAGYTGFGVSSDDFLNQVVLKVRSNYGAILGADFGSGFGDMTGTTWYGPAVTWPSDPANAAWIKFWRDMDTAIDGRLGMVALGDDFWATFSSGPVGSEVMTVTGRSDTARLTPSDQRGRSRPAGLQGDIGAIEK